MVGNDNSIQSFFTVDQMLRVEALKMADWAPEIDKRIEDVKKIYEFLTEKEK